MKARLPVAVSRWEKNLLVLLDDLNWKIQRFFIFIDNSTAEAAFFRGSSKSRLLFELILELRELKMKCKTRIHFVHVAGTQMIAQGSDGLSIGNISEGVMKGIPMDDFIPLNKSALERSISLKTWLESWADGNLEFLCQEIGF